MRKRFLLGALLFVLLITGACGQRLVDINKIGAWQEQKDSLGVLNSGDNNGDLKSGFSLKNIPYTRSVGKKQLDFQGCIMPEDIPGSLLMLKKQELSGSTLVVKDNRSDVVASVLPEDSIIDDGTRIKGVGRLIELGFLSFRPVDEFYLGTDVAYDGNSELYNSLNTVYARGKYYTSTGYSAMGMLMNHTFYIFNAETGELEESILVSESGWFGYPTQMAYNPVTDQIWGIVYDGLQRPYLGRLNDEMDPSMATGMFDMICQFYGSVACMAFSPDGELYAINTEGELITIDLQTGEMDLIASTGIPKVDLSSMAFDYYTGKLYWSAFTYGDPRGSDLSCDFYEVDPQTAGLRLIKHLKDHTTILGLHVESPEAEAKAPYVVDQLSVVPDSPGALGADIHIKAPSVAFDKTPLTGVVDLSLRVDDISVEEIEAEAGEELVVPFTFTSGVHKVSVIASNEEGSGVEGSVTIYAGSDIPSAVTNLQMECSIQGLATLTWDAPSSGLNGGFLDSGNLKYEVLRVPDSVDCGIFEETEVQLQLPSVLDRYSFQVTPVCGSLVGPSMETNSIVYGDGIEIPFSVQGTDEEFQNLSTMINNDSNDYNWWGNYVISSGIGKTDDWYITPPFQLDEGVYRLRIRYKGLLENPTNMKFTLANNNTLEAHTSRDAKVIKDHKDLDNKEYWLDEYLTIDEAGKYSVGINVYRQESDGLFSSAGWFDLSIEPGPGALAPGQPTHIFVERGANGELTAKITFTAPTESLNGQELESLQKIQVYNGERLVTTVNRAQIGQTYTVEDQNASQGFNTYKVTAVNEHGEGGFAQSEIYVGLDAPVSVGGISVSPISNYVASVSWKQPSVEGLNGGYVDLESVRYKLSRADASWGFVGIPGADSLTVTSAVIDETLNIAVLGQSMLTYGVTPHNGYGEGQMLSAGIVLGKPYERFFFESFTSSAMSTSYWSRSVLSGSGQWYLDNGSGSGIYPQDNDGGLVVFRHIDSVLSSCALITPILSLAESVSPMLSFYMYHDKNASSSASLEVQAVGADGKFSMLKLIPLNDGDGWKQYTVDLKSYNSQERVFVAFVGTAVDPQTMIAIDNVSVYENIEKDLELSSVSVPGVMVAGEPAIIKGVIRNVGMADADSFTVEVYADEELLSEVEGGGLGQCEDTVFALNVSPMSKLVGSDVVLRVQVSFAGDENLGNNTVERQLAVASNEMPVPRNVSHTFSGGIVNITWQAPEESSIREVTEDFENYDAFTIDDFAPWRVWDEDRQLTSYIAGTDYDNIGMPMAYQIWNPSVLGSGIGNGWNPYSGKQCLVSWASMGVYSDFTLASATQNDDWLISPRIVGGTSLSFYAKEATSQYGSEEFEVWVSYTTPEKEKFSVLGSETLQSTSWTKYEYALPSDARYFAIRCISSDKFALLIDDIKYTSGYNVLSLIGYNVYKGGELLTETPISELSFSDESSIGDEYMISAVYEEGESDLVKVVVGSTGMDSDSYQMLKAWSDDGNIVLTGAENQVVEVYDLRGVLIRRIGNAGDLERIPVPQTGLYLLRIGERTLKVPVL